VPDSARQGDLERLRERSLLREFQEYAGGKGRLRVFRTGACAPVPNTPGTSAITNSSSLLITLAGQGKRIFETHKAHVILGGSRPATYKLLHDLVQKGWLQPLSKGQYLIIPLETGPERRYTMHEFLIAHHLAPAGYIAYWTALHHHGLTEQIPRMVWVAVSKRRTTTTISGVTYRCPL
jgi:predicted transcriptional regulator of viral defense system